MSKDNVKLMFEKIEKDGNLQKKYADLMRSQNDKTENILSEKLIKFGKSHGFLFSKDDLTETRTELIDKINQNKELSDNDLANVAGGDLMGSGNNNKKLVAVLTSTLSVGIACALVSAIAEIESKSSCGKKLSTTEKC